MANLLKWGKDRLDQAQGIVAQINPLDGGRTYDTNQRGVAPGTPNPTDMRNPNTPGFQLTNNSFTRGASRAFDQINPIDNNRTWKQTAPVGANRSTGQQLLETGFTGAIAQPAIGTAQKSLNTIASGVTPAIGLGLIAKESLFGSDKSYVDKVNEIDGIGAQFLEKGGGYGGKGGFLSPKQAASSGGGWESYKNDFIKPTVAATAEVAPYVVPVGAAPAGAGLAARALIGAGENAVVGGATNAASQWVNNGKVDPREVATNAALGAGIGAAIPVGGALLKGAVNKATPAITEAVDKVALSSGAANHPAVQELNAAAERITQQREKLLGLGLSENAPAVKANDAAYASIVSERNNTLKAISEGGYVKVPGKGDPEAQIAKNFKKLDEISAKADEASANLDKAKAIYKEGSLPSSNEMDLLKAVDQKLAVTPLDERGSVQLPGQKPDLPTPISPKVGKDQVKDQVPLKTALKDSSSAAPEPPHSLNIDKFNISKKGKQALSELQTQLKDEVEKARGTPLTQQEVRQFAEESATVLRNPRVRAATKDMSAQLLNLRQQNAALIEKRTAGTLTGEEAGKLNEGLIKQYQAAADAGRMLNAFKDTANPRQQTVLDVMLKEIAKNGEDVKAAIEASKKLGPNPTAKEQAEFYRTFVKATKEDWLDKYRYTNMLSSPLTHATNIVSNLEGVAGVAPAQKIFEGATDAMHSAVTGAPRTRFASEAGSYYKGVAKSVPDALKAFKNVMSDKTASGNPDIDSLRNIPLATKGAKGVADRVLSFVPKLLEASDQLGTTLARGGEEASLIKRSSKGVKVDLSPDAIFKQTDEAAKYRLFRQEMKKEGQGHILDAIDIPAQTIQKLRQSDNPYVRNIAKFAVPFVATPTNIFKQGIEYSPAGIITLHGAADKTAQAAKTLMGTATIATAVGAIAAGGDITFGEPTNTDQRNAFRAEGKQAYAFKLPGTDKWINYSKLHPAIAMNLAIVGAVKDAQDKGSLSESGATRAMNTGAGILNYFTDQSYMKNVGDFVNVLAGKDNTNAGTIISSQATNTSGQLIPFKSLASWAGRIVDATQRKVDTKAGTLEQVYQGIVRDIPGLNRGVPTRDNPYTGEPLKNDYALFNAFNPNRVTKDRGFGNTTGLNLQQREMNRDLPVDQREPFRRGVIEEKFAAKQDKAEKDAIQDGKKVPLNPSTKQPSSDQGNSEIKQLSSGKFYAKVGDKYETYDTKAKAEEALAKKNLESSDEKIKEVGNKVFYKDGNGEVKTKTKTQWNYDKTDSEVGLAMDRAKSSGDVEGWFTAAQKKIVAMNELKNSYDPTTESDKINDITKKMEDLKDETAKYQSYGGFKKGSSGGRSGSGKGKKGFQAPTSGGISLVGKSADNRALIVGKKLSVPRLRRKF